MDAFRTECPRLYVPVVSAFALLLSACSPSTAARPMPGDVSTTDLRKVEAGALCVTDGKVRDIGSGVMEVNSPEMRAVVAGSAPEVAEMRFRYEGPTAETSALANGEIRRQAGLKLRAADSCNVVYVVWRFEPEARLVVQVKNNPGKHRHAECGDAGYQNVPPRKSSPVPLPLAGEEHFLQARLDGSDLSVYVDHELAWQGDIGSDATFGGPVGIRTDNARLVFEMAAVSRDQSADCRQYGAVP
jgi:hypothetical protein